MQEASRRGDQARLTALLPQVRGHTLEPWAAYWELKGRLDTVTATEVRDFFTRYASTYQEDRLRNDWLLQAGYRRDWATFTAEYPRLRMRDDPQLRCYAVALDVSQGRAVDPAAIEQVRSDWFAQREMDDGCLLAVTLLHQAGQLPFQDLWLRARLAMEANRPALARSAVEIDVRDAGADVAQIQNNAMRYLGTFDGRKPLVTRKRMELVTLALIKIASNDPGQAAAQMERTWAAHLEAAQRNWIWGVIGRQAAQRVQPGVAAGYFAKVTRERDLGDGLLAWKTRIALRQGQWREVASAIEAMSEGARRDSAWRYWLARAKLALARSDDDRAAAHELLEDAAKGSEIGFYEKLALEELGRPIIAPPAPAPLTEQEREAARQHVGLNRALFAMAHGLRPEGVREWNYWTRLHTPGGMTDRELYAAADLACSQQVWDRCISASERTKTFAAFEQRFPMPFRDAVMQQAQAVGLDPAYMYGLIRQESRFIFSARSTVGAAGLMQLMPRTASWTARKIGLPDFTLAQLDDRDTNLRIGAGYLKLVLAEFHGSMPLAAAAYNAGPSRARAWRNSGPTPEGAVWVENVPFSETRDYVKKVLSNTIDYAAILSGQPQSIKARLDTIGPPQPGEEPLTKDLP
jgi:soluble lytic murein transglycosylase